MKNQEMLIPIKLSTQQIIDTVGTICKIIMTNKIASKDFIYTFCRDTHLYWDDGQILGRNEFNAIIDYLDNRGLIGTTQTHAYSYNTIYKYDLKFVLKNQDLEILLERTPESLTSYNLIFDRNIKEFRIIDSNDGISGNDLLITSFDKLPNIEDLILKIVEFIQMVY